MNRDMCIEKIIEIFINNVTCICFTGEDINLSECVEDSITFMTILVDLEEAFQIEFPDEILQIDCFNSLYNLADIILNLMTKQS